jgi:BASS family bile acid:Na+ symporter
MPILLDKAAQTIGIVVIPVVLGMGPAAKAPLSERLDKPVKILSAAVVVTFSVAAIVKEWSALVDGFAQVGAAVTLFNAISVTVRYSIGRAATESRRDNYHLSGRRSQRDTGDLCGVGRSE